MAEELHLSLSIPVEAKVLFDAWLDSQQHTQFTGSPAEIEPGVGGRFTAWDGYISGITEVIEPPHRIVQRWRTTDFPPDAPDSRLEILFHPDSEGVFLTLNHTNIPDGQADGYRQGWVDFYFDPMKEFFSE